MVLPLLSAWPRLGERLAPVSLGVFPTPVERMTILEQALGATAPLYVKRDDLSSPLYGGNKVRTLEVLFGLARARGARQVVATGAFGSNHAVATVIHAPRVELEPGAILFSQPASRAALENLRVTAARARVFHAIPGWALLPWAVWRARAPGRVVMVPGGATPDGALGYVAAALELAEQVRSGVLPRPERIFVGIGSTCTTAGLLVGLTVAARSALGFVTPPTVVAVRVTPWPVTSRFRILRLAERTAEHLATLTGEPSLRVSARELSPRLVVDGRELGAGYGRPSTTGLRAIEMFRTLGLFELDTTYSAKAAAGFLRAARAPSAGPLLFWSTKSTAPLPEVPPEELAALPAFVRRWMRRAEISAG